MSDCTFTRPGQVAPDRPAPDKCMTCGQPEGSHDSGPTLASLAGRVAALESRVDAAATAEAIIRRAHEAEFGQMIRQARGGQRGPRHLRAVE